MRMRSIQLSSALLATVLALPCVNAAEVEKVKAEDIYPDTTLGLLSIPDLAATRTAFGKTQIADMFAQPEMQQFLAPAIDQLRKTYTELRTKNPLLPALTDLDRGFLSGEITLGVIPRAGQDGPPVGAVLILRPEKFESLARLLEPAVGGELPPDGKPFLFGDEKDPNAPALAQWHGRLLFGVPAAELTKTLERLKLPGGKGTLGALDSFAAARAQLKFPAGYLFFNPAETLETVTTLQANDPEFTKVRQAGKALGVSTLNTLLVSLGISNDELVMEGAMHVASGQKASGLVGLMLSSNEPASKEALKVAAADAPYVAATRVEWSGYLARIREMLSTLGFGRQFDSVLLMVDFRLGFNLEHDLIENLGAETVIVRTALNTAPPLSMGIGFVASIALKDAAKVESCLQRLHKSFGTTATGNPIADMVQFRTLDYNGKTIYYLKQVMSSTWSFAVVNNRLLAGTSVNAVKRSLDQLNAKDDILSNATFQQTIARLMGKPFDAANLPGGFAFQTDESSGGSPLVLTMLGVGASTAALAVAAEQINPPVGDEGDFNGSDPLANVEKFFKRPSGQIVAAVARNVDMGLWPDEGFFMKYRRARGAVWTGDPVSMYFRTELPFPNMASSGTATGGLVTIAAVGVLASLALPVLGRARESARRASVANNMSQLGKALVMYADNPHNAEYPADASELYPDYAGDVRLFIDIRFPNQDAGYLYIPGSSPNDATNLVLYENVPEQYAAMGRNVLYGNGTVEWVGDAAFKALLEKTEAALKEKGVEFKPQLVSRTEVAKRKK